MRWLKFRVWVRINQKVLKALGAIALAAAGLGPVVAPLVSELAVSAIAQEAPATPEPVVVP